MPRACFLFFGIFLCANLFGTEKNTDNWQDWSLVVPVEEKRTFVSGGRSSGVNKPVLAGEISLKTQTIESKWKQHSSYPFSRKNYKNLSSWEKQIFSAYEDFFGWKMPFEDYCRKNGNRPHFAALDIRLKSELAVALIEESVSASLERSREYWQMGVSLFSELLNEFRPGRAAFLEAEIDKTKDGFEKQTQNVFLERARFDYYRQKELQKIFKLGHITHSFLAGLNHLLKNDYEAQVRLCGSIGIFRKLELSRYNRPDLSQKILSNFQEKHSSHSPQSTFVSGDDVLVLSGNAGPIDESLSKRTADVQNFFGKNWERAAQRILNDCRLDLTRQEFEQTRLSQVKSFVPILLDWKMPFEDYCGKTVIRYHFSTGDILLKQSVLKVLMSPTTLKSISDSQEADDLCELACDLLSELLDEYQPGSEEQLQTEIEKSAPEDFSPFAKNTVLLRTKFNHERQKAIGKFLKNGFIDVFLACLEHLYGNDIEAQLRACSRAGIRGKIDLTKYRRPTLSDEAILQYEQREQQDKR